MSYTNRTFHGKHSPGIIYLNPHQVDESIIHINKYRFMDFYYEELDKLNVKYYQSTSDEPSIANTSIPEEPVELSVETSSRSVPVNIPFQPNVRRYKLDSLNNQLTNTSSPIPSPAHSLTNPQQNSMSNSGLDFSMSPPITQHITGSSIKSKTQLINNSLSPIANSNTELNHVTNLDFYTPSTSHQTIMKRVYDNYLCINIDCIIPIIQQAQSSVKAQSQTHNTQQQQYNPKHKISSDVQNIITAAHDFITDQCTFLIELVTGPSKDPFNLFNMSTIGLLFDSMHKSGFKIHHAHTELCKITAELTSRCSSAKQNIKQSILDSAIGILKNTVDELSDPAIMVSTVLFKSLSIFISWVYMNYQVYWMHDYMIQISLKLAATLSIRFGPQLVDDIYTTIKKYFIPSYLFSISRTSWRFTNIHKRKIAKLRALIIPPSHKNQWILKCVEQTRTEIPWVFPDSPHIKNLVVFIDGRNCFYADEYQKTNGGVNLELLRRFLNLSDYHNILADLVYGRIASLMTGGRHLNIHDPRYVVPVIIFNERHRQQIQPLVPNNRLVIYTPRGQDDDLLTLYLWLSNPGSFIASNDNYGNHAARLTHSTHETKPSTANNTPNTANNTPNTTNNTPNTTNPIYSTNSNANFSKYYEGLWVELTKCFKLINPLGNIQYVTSTQGINTHYPSTSAPF